MKTINLIFTVILTIQIYLTEALSVTEPLLPQNCIGERRENIFPYISDSKGRFLRFFHFRDRDNQEKGNSTLDTFPSNVYINLPWGNSSITLILSKHSIHTSENHREWTAENVTYLQILDEDCYYQGRVSGHVDSHVAVSICNGLMGHIYTEAMAFTVYPKYDRHVSDVKGLLHDLHVCKMKAHKNDRQKTLRRRKRQTSAGRKYLEVLIAVDTSVTEFVGKENINVYVLTLMNIVNRVYKHDTLTVDIEVVTVKILQIDKNTERTIIVRNDARRTVDNFCRWTTVQAFNNQYYGGGYNFDVAVYLTRTGIGPAGYAPITGLCNPSRSCAVVKDEGITSAFIIAHEIAHVFGLYHNGHGNRCRGRQYQTNIMATMVQSTLQQYWWSECSNTRMEQVVPMLKCLNNKPGVSLDDLTLPLGPRFSLDEQCRLEFGDSHGLCKTFYGDMCPMLWCSEKRSPRLCKTKRGRPLEGSICGKEMWCEAGSCVYFGRHSPVDGGWSDWSNWTECSADCGNGVKQRTRSCTNPRVKYGGKDCEGKSEEIDTCRSEVCTIFTDTRKLQCTVLNSVPVRPGYHTWLPYQTTNPKHYCVLTCMSNKTGEVATFDDIPVDNGTPCTYDNQNNICIDGKCMEVGCDGKTNSDAKEDKCGVCRGNGTDCKVVAGVYSKKLRYKPRSQSQYFEAIVLPQGARNIDIKETATIPHFLALYDPGYGTFYFNGNSRQGRSKKFAAKGAWFTYVNNYGHEKLFTKGPIYRKLFLLVYPQNSHSIASISYRYTTDKNDFTHEKLVYKYKYEGWTDCSVTCGIGHQSLIYGCYNKETDKKVNSSRCHFLKDPTGDPVKCERTECNAEIYKWALSVAWSECNATCGSYGVQHQKYKCVKETRNGKVEDVDMKTCSILEPPSQTRECNRKPCTNYKWKMMPEWTECSETCGENGIKTKIYKCYSDTDEEVDSDHCKDKSKQESAVSCNRIPCITSWYRLDSTNDWGPCSATCGWDGIQERIDICHRITSNDDIEKVEYEKCNNLQGEREFKPCNRKACKNGKYRWVLMSDWSECSASCGESGVQSRSHGCFEVTYENAAKLVEDIVCDESLKIEKPNDTRDCNIRPCESYNWISSNWSACSRTCGDEGIQVQLYTCEKSNADGSLESVNNSFCEGLDKVNFTKKCILPHCTKTLYKWVLSTNWTDCSVSCGRGGLQFQIYNCYSYDVTDRIEEVDPLFCQDPKPPSNTRDCNTGPCETYRWSSSFDWGHCSETCGNNGIQTQIKVCEKVSVDGLVVPTDSKMCVNEKNILETRPCNRIPCQNWKYRIIRTSNLTDCSESCGSNGKQEYIHKCQKEFLNGKLEDTEMNFCSDIVYPRETVPCNRIPCLQEWYSSDWGKCSVTCGVGIQKRELYCGPPDKPFNIKFCPDEKPNTSQICNQRECPIENCKDRISICKRSASRRKCRYRGYKKMCCMTCKKFIRFGK